MSITLILTIGCAFIVFLLVMGLAAFFRSDRDEAEDKVRNRLKQFALTEVESDAIDLVHKYASMNRVSPLNRLIANLRVTATINKTIRQADTRGNAAVYLLCCGLLGIAGLYAGIILADRLWVGMVLGGILGYSPLWNLNRLKGKRMDRFQQQLPDALDLMSRALKAGHTFTGGLRMVADEFEDPIAGEFRITLDEINFGMDPDRAMANLQSRVDVTDLKFFIVSVNIQRETGGNLAEIISNIARLVRERFILFGKVRILSAEGRISAILLSALPFVITAILYFINSDYMSLLWTRDLGRSMAWGAGMSMVLGIIVMRRMVNIKV